MTFKKYDTKDKFMNIIKPNPAPTSQNMEVVSMAIDACFFIWSKLQIVKEHEAIVLLNKLFFKSLFSAINKI
jgi:hypothetical protein